MEVRRFFKSAAVFALILAAMMLSGLCAYAADEVIFENGRVETGEEYEDLNGWGRELYSRCIFEADVKFKGEGSGITLRSADNTKEGTSIRAVMRNDKLTLAADGGTGSYYIYYIEVDPETVYHIRLIGSYGVSNGEIDMTVDILDSEGNITDTKNYYLILMNKMFASSGVGPEHIRIEANTVADNIRVTELRPDSLKLVSPPVAVTPGSSTVITARPQREGVDLDYELPIAYSVDGEGVSISEDGVLTVSADAPAQIVTVTAKSGGMTDSAEISVMSEDIFTINTGVLNEDSTVLDSVKAVKNYFYDGTAVFVVTLYDKDGVLKDCFVKYVPAKAITARTEADVAIGYTLPSDFSPESDTIEIQAWGASGASDFDVTEGEIGMRSFFEENGGAVEWIEEHKVVAGMLDGRTMVLQINNPVVFTDGAAKAAETAPYINENGSTVITNEIAGSLRHKE